jgi:hypothetical protein
MKPIAAVLLACLVTTAAAVTAVAQTPPQFLSVVRVEVRPGELGSWESYQRQMVDAQRRVGDQRPVSRFQTWSGGPVGLFHVVLPFQEFSEIDDWRSLPELLREAYGDDEGMRILGAGAALEASVETVVHVLRPELSSGLNQDASGLPILQLVTTEVDPARLADYEAFLRALAAAEDERGIRRIRRVSTTGELYRYSAVEQFSSFADFRASPGPEPLMIDVYGEVLGRNLLDRANAAVRSREILVLRLREDLSYTPT